MDTLAAAQTNVTLSAEPARAGYPATVLGALQKACGWVFLTSRYTGSLSDFEVACRAGLPECAPRERARRPEWLEREEAQMHEFFDEADRQFELREAEARARHAADVRLADEATQ